MKEAVEATALLGDDGEGLEAEVLVGVVEESATCAKGDLFRCWLFFWGGGEGWAAVRMEKVRAVRRRVRCILVLGGRVGGEMVEDGRAVGGTEE